MTPSARGCPSGATARGALSASDPHRRRRGSADHPSRNADADLALEGGVTAGLTSAGVPARPADQSVVAVASLEEVVAAITEGGVVAAAAPELVSAASSAEPVVAARSGRGVPRRRAHDDIGGGGCPATAGQVDGDGPTATDDTTDHPPDPIVAVAREPEVPVGPTGDPEGIVGRREPAGIRERRDHPGRGDAPDPVVVTAGVPEVPVRTRRDLPGIVGGGQPAGIRERRDHPGRGDAPDPVGCHGWCTRGSRPDPP